MIVGKPGPHKSEMPLLRKILSLTLYRNKQVWDDFLESVEYSHHQQKPLTRQKPGSHMTATTTTAFLPPNPPQKHNCKPCNCPTTTTQHPRNNAASHHSDLTRHELRGLVCDSVCLDHLLRPRLNISHCYPPMDSWEGTMCLIADGR